MPRPDHLHVRLRGQQRQIAADHLRITEVGQHIAGSHQRAAGYTWPAQGPEHIPEHLPAGGAHVIRRIFQIGGDGADHAINDGIGIGKERDGLHDPKAEPAVDVHVQAQKLLGHDALDTEQQNVAEGHDKRRGDNGQQRHEFEQALTGHIQPRDDIGKQECHGGTGNGGDTCHEQAVFDCLEPANLGKQLHVVLRAGEDNHADDRVYHKESDK